MKTDFNTAETDVAAPTDRELEVRAAKACGFTLRKNALSGIDGWTLFDRHHACISYTGSADLTEEDAWSILAPQFIHDGNASDLLLDDLRRRRYAWSEGRSDGPNLGSVLGRFWLEYTMSLYERGSQIAQYNLGPLPPIRIQDADRRRCRLRAFLASHDGWIVCPACSSLPTDYRSRCETCRGIGAIGKEPAQ